MNKKNMIFSFPITDFSKQPAQFFTNLLITAEVSIGREITTSVKCIRYTEQGTANTAKITSFLEVVAPEIYSQIKQAAQEKAVDEFENLCIAKLDSTLKQ